MENNQESLNILETSVVCIALILLVYIIGSFITINITNVKMIDSCKEIVGGGVNYSNDKLVDCVEGLNNIK